MFYLVLSTQCAPVIIEPFACHLPVVYLSFTRLLPDIHETAPHNWGTTPRSAHKHLHWRYWRYWRYRKYKNLHETFETLETLRFYLYCTCILLVLFFLACINLLVSFLLDLYQFYTTLHLFLLDPFHSVGQRVIETIMRQHRVILVSRYTLYILCIYPVKLKYASFHVYMQNIKISHDKLGKADKLHLVLFFT